MSTSDPFSGFTFAKTDKKHQNFVLKNNFLTDFTAKSLLK